MFRWNVNNDTAKNVIIFGIDNSLSSHTDNPKNNFLVLGKEAIEVINGSVSAAEKKSINFSKANTKFCLSLKYDGDRSYFKTGIYKFKVSDNQRFYKRWTDFFKWYCVWFFSW